MATPSGPTEIDAEDFPGRPHLASGEQTVQARPAAQVEDGLPRTQVAQAEGVADAAKGFGHGGRQGIEVLRIVPQLLGTGGTDWELMLLLGRVGGCFHEVSFEQLEADPIGQMRELYEVLALPDFKTVQPMLQQYVESLAGYKKNALPDLPVELQARMAREWRRCFEEWGYSP